MKLACRDARSAGRQPSSGLSREAGAVSPDKQRHTLVSKGTGQRFAALAGPPYEASLGGKPYSSTEHVDGKEKHAPFTSVCEVRGAGGCKTVDEWCRVHTGTGPSRLSCWEHDIFEGVPDHRVSCSQRGVKRGRPSSRGVCVAGSFGSLHSLQVPATSERHHSSVEKPAKHHAGRIRAAGYVAQRVSRACRPGTCRGPG